MMHTIPAIVIKIISILFPIVGVVFTIARLILSVRSRRLWWDDYLGLTSAIFAMSLSAAMWVRYSDPDHLTRTTRVVLYYVIAECFYAALWLARLSILCSILRIIPENRTRTVLQCAACVFTTFLILLGSQIVWICENQPHWKDKRQPQCFLGFQVAVFQLLSSLISDTILIFVPAQLLIPSGLERGTKTRLMVIFGAAALTTFVSIVHAAFIFEGHPAPREIIAGIVEVGVSLTVCNFVVVLPFIWRSCGMYQGSSIEEQTIQLTTVRFSSPTTYRRSAAPNANAIFSRMERGTPDLPTGSITDDLASDALGRKSFEGHGRAGEFDVLQRHRTRGENQIPVRVHPVTLPGSSTSLESRVGANVQDAMQDAYTGKAI